MTPGCDVMPPVVNISGQKEAFLLSYSVAAPAVIFKNNYLLFSGATLNFLLLSSVAALNWVVKTDFRDQRPVFRESSSRLF